MHIMTVSMTTVHLMTVRKDTHLRILQGIDLLGIFMTSPPSVGRMVSSRERYSRIFAIGDRNDPVGFTPSFVLMENDDDLEVDIAPFRLVRNSTIVPAKLTLQTRGKICPPFDELVEWNASEGLSLPPSLDESDAGTFPTGEGFLPLTIQSLLHDPSLSKINTEPSVVCFLDSPQLVNDDERMIKAIDTVRRRFPASLIWMPGISGPDNCAILSWMGIDLMDLSRVKRAFASGVHISSFGPRARDLTQDDSEAWSVQLHAWREALIETRQAIQSGRIRNLAEACSLSSPRSVQRLRRHDEYMSKIAITDPGKAGLSSSLKQGRTVDCTSKSSREDPLIRHWQHSISSRWRPHPHQSKVAVLLPCSAVKPYRKSPSHARFRQAIDSRAVSELMITAPLGVVPRALEVLWPAASYDIPVTGHWDADELNIIQGMMSKIISRNDFEIIINHSGIKIEVNGVACIDTRLEDSAGSEEALARLKKEVKHALREKNLTEPKRGENILESFKSISRHLYGSDIWLEGARATGRAPDYRIMKDKNQIAIWNSKSGRFSFSKSSLEILDETNTVPRVYLNDGFKWSGDIFSTNISSFSGSPRAGDEMIVFQEGKLIGSARAIAPAWEWPKSPGALARARHRL